MAKANTQTKTPAAPEASTDAPKTEAAAATDAIKTIADVTTVDAADPAATPLQVSTLPGVARFCRAGHCFGPEPTLLDLDDLTEEQLNALLREKQLIVAFVVQGEDAAA